MEGPLDPPLKIKRLGPSSRTSPDRRRVNYRETWDQPTRVIGRLRELSLSERWLRVRHLRLRLRLSITDQQLRLWLRVVSLLLQLRSPLEHRCTLRTLAHLRSHWLSLVEVMVIHLINSTTRMSSSRASLGRCGNETWGLCRWWHRRHPTRIVTSFRLRPKIGVDELLGLLLLGQESSGLSGKSGFFKI